MAGTTGAQDAIKRRITIKDVADAAGVSQSTASRALTGRGYVANAVRDRVRLVAADLGYVPDALARHLKQQQSRSIGVLVFDLRNPFYADLAAGAGAVARASGYSVMLADLGGGSTPEVEAVEAFVAMRVAGVVATPISGEITKYLERHGIPIIEVDRQFAPDTADAVVVDNFAAAHGMTNHLLDLGHRRIALLIDETDWTSGKRRYEGFNAAMSARGIDVDMGLVVPTGWNASDAQKAAARILKEAGRPTAIFAANNVLAEGAWRAVMDAQLRIPEDISLVAFDDAPWMSMVDPGLTTVAQNGFGLGEASIHRLLERTKEQAQLPRTVMLQAPMIKRESTGPPPENGSTV